MLTRAIRLAVQLTGIAAVLLVTILVWRDFDSVQPVAPISHVERWVEPISSTGWGKAEFRDLATQVPDFRNARWETVPLPDTRPIPARANASVDLPVSRTWIRALYVVPAGIPSDQSVAVFVPRIMGGAWSFYANDQLLASNARDWRMQWNRALYVQLPLALSQPGSVIDIKIAVPFRLAQGYAVGSLRIGPEGVIYPIYSQRVLFQTTLPAVVLMVILLMGAWSFQFWLVRRSESQHLFMALAALAWAIFALQFFYDIESNALAALWLAPFVDAAIAWVFLFMYLFASRADNRYHPRFEAVLSAYAVLDVLTTWPIWSWQVNALLLQHWLHVAYCALIGACIVWFAIENRRREMAVLSAALWGMVAMGAHDLTYVTGQHDPDVQHLLPYGMLGVFISFQHANQRRYISALQDIERSNEVLNQRLEERERELAANYRRLADAEQRQTLLLERQRLMQDMHDGIGSSLMSSLAVIETGSMHPERIGSLLRECIDELRLVIHSLEPIEYDLITLLASLRQRLGRRLETSGIKLVWRMGDIPPIPWLEAPQALQILRIMQELLTNVLKHAKASEVCIASDRATDKNGWLLVAISVSDNGIGFDFNAVERGKGLNNIQERAARLGCQVKFQTLPTGGTTATLVLPVDV